jgi:predicted  nucleic acid-binding Zn-ribbon protein
MGGVYAKLKHADSQFGAAWLDRGKVSGLDTENRVVSGVEIYTEDPDTIEILKKKTSTFRVYDVPEGDDGKEPEPEGPITTDNLKGLIDIKCNKCGKTFSAQNSLVPTCPECVTGKHDSSSLPGGLPEDGTDGSANESLLPHDETNADEDAENDNADVGSKKKTYGERKCINAENEEWQGCEQIFTATHRAQNYCPSCREIRRIMSKA